MAFNLILFDFDFTLADTSNCLIPALRRALQEVCSKQATDDEIKLLIGIPLERQFDILSGHSNRAYFDMFRRVFLDERDGLEETGSILIPGAKEALELLCTQYTLGVVSTGQVGRIKRILVQRGVIEHFYLEAIIGGAADKSEGIKRALQELRISATNTIYVGDRPDDGAAAKKAGVSFVGVTSGAFTAGAFGSSCPVLGSIAALPTFLASQSNAASV
jgi:phosphoglycolate phosphatase